MLNLKKDRVFGHGRNLALNSIVKVDDDDDDRTQGFRPMVSSAVWGKRLRRDKSHILTGRTRKCTLCKIVTRSKSQFM